MRLNIVWFFYLTTTEPDEVNPNFKNCLVYLLDNYIFNELKFSP